MMMTFIFRGGRKPTSYEGERKATTSESMDLEVRASRALVRLLPMYICISFIGIHTLLLCITRGYGYHSPVTSDVALEEGRLVGRRRRVAG